MENQLNQDLLYTASAKVLHEIKIEAIDCLKSYHETENIITNKAIGLLQILFPVFVAIFGFIVIELQNNRNSVILCVASFEAIVIFLAVYSLYEILVLKKVALSGSVPSDVLKLDIVNKSQDENLLHFLRIKIYSLQNAISACQVSHEMRKNKLKMSLNILLTGTCLVLVIFFVCLFLANYVLHKG